ncbi:Pentapeptide repeat-containing protein [Monaibacterium marinum]|uniref:Pentapeptide repeat-containing protein n=1 Tax=Pontivivens marinum TaxID=1690039 RepID=A0A2C9CQ79_9RHOB|nr:pentapeptide repeat-containing protein [Monaibacterium marinum]SOH93484.1 Pentapeptide repeat-containing protein [Monaibacterium marinum]
MKAWLSKWLERVTGDSSRFEVDNAQLEGLLWRLGKGALFGLLIYFVAIAILMAFHLVGALMSVLNSKPEPDADLRGYAYLLIALVGLPFVIWRSVVAQQQAKTAEQGLFTDRFTKAIDQLGAERSIKSPPQPIEQGDSIITMQVEESVPNIEVRIGAIYALERLAIDSARDQGTIIKILCVYIRTHAKMGTVYAKKYLNVEPRADIQAAINAIISISRLFNELKEDINLSGSMLSKVNFSRANISNLILSYSYIAHSNFKYSTLHGMEARFSDISNANFAYADLTGADLRHTELSLGEPSFVFNGATLTGAHVGGAEWEGFSSLHCEHMASIFGNSRTNFAWLAVKDHPIHWAKSDITFFEESDQYNNFRKTLGLPPSS